MVAGAPVWRIVDVDTEQPIGAVANRVDTTGDGDGYRDRNTAEAEARWINARLAATAAARAAVK